MDKRLYHIDNAKAIGMMLIVASHVMPSAMLSENHFYKIWCGILASFYMPLFFMLSGIFESRSSDFKIMKRRMFKLVKYCLIFYAFGIVSCLFMSDKLSYPVIYGRVGTIWFLYVLLWLTGIVGVVKNKKYSLYAFTLLSLGGVILSYYDKSLFKLGQALLCLPFYLFGYYAKEYLKCPNFNYKVAGLSLMGWCVVYFVFFKEQNVSLNMVNQDYLAFYAEAIMGSLFVIEVCKLFQIKALSYYGKNTIIPMMVQMTLLVFIQRFFEAHSMVDYFLIAVVACVLTGLCIPLFRNRYYDLFS